MSYQMLSDPRSQVSTETAVDEIRDENLLRRRISSNDLDIPEVMENMTETFPPEETTFAESTVRRLSTISDANSVSERTSSSNPSYEILRNPGNSGVMESTTEIFQPEEITFLEHIGRGGMSSISLYRSHKASYPSLVAVKTLLPGFPARNECIPTLRYLKTELNILTVVDHQNIVRTFGITNIQSGFGLVMEYLPNGCYSDFFANYWERFARTPEAHSELSLLKIRILTEIINAMEYLHRPRTSAQFDTKQSILHLDLKGENVLLDKHLHVKICDFGLSMMATLTKLRSSTTMHDGSPSGTAGFIAPERFLHPNSKPNTKCDVYSFGILQYTILTDLPPYNEDISRTLALLVHHVTENNVRPNVDCIPTCYHTNLTELMVKCWSPLPADRPAFKELRRQVHNFVESNFEEFEEEATRSANSVVSQVQHDGSLTDPIFNPSSTPTPTFDRNAHAEGTTAGLKLPLTPRVPGAGIEQDTIEEDFSASGDTPLVLDTKNDSGGVDLTKPFFSATKILLAVSALVILAAVVTIYVAVPPIHNWNLLIRSCSTVTSPNHGKVSCENQTANTPAKCQFSCDSGYALSGDDTTSCIDGRWTQKKPLCEKSNSSFMLQRTINNETLRYSVCHKLATPKDGMATCTNKTFGGSNCSFACMNNHIITGKPTITCLKDGNWSDPAPSCICPHCKVGDTCEYSVSWQVIAGALGNMQVTGSISVNYSGISFSCQIELHSLLPKLLWTGICVDSETGTEQDCRGVHTSKSYSAKAAAAALIRRLVAQKQYPEPCDADLMPTAC